MLVAARTEVYDFDLTLTSLSQQNILWENRKNTNKNVKVGPSHLKKKIITLKIKGRARRKRVSNDDMWCSKYILAKLMIYTKMARAKIFKKIVGKQTSLMTPQV